MKKISEKEKKKIKQQLHISDRKTIEERGKQNRSCIFEDKKKKERNNMCNSNVVKRIIDDEIR